MSQVEFTGRCELCDTVQRVTYALVRWKLTSVSPYENLARCTDRSACRARVEARGEEWAVDDGEGDG